jgi:hypothetical protein
MLYVIEVVVIADDRRQHRKSRYNLIKDILGIIGGNPRREQVRLDW